MVPTMRAAAQFLNVNRRRISLEILRPSSENENGTVETATEVLPWNPENEVIEDEDLVILRIYYLTRKPNEKEGGAIESDDMDNDNDDGTVYVICATLSLRCR